VTALPSTKTAPDSEHHVRNGSARRPTIGRDLSLPAAAIITGRVRLERWAVAAAIRGAVSKFTKGVVHLQTGSFMPVY